MEQKSSVHNVITEKVVLTMESTPEIWVWRFRSKQAVVWHKMQHLCNKPRCIYSITLQVWLQHPSGQIEKKPLPNFLYRRTTERKQTTTGAISPHHTMRSGINGGWCCFL